MVHYNDKNKQMIKCDEQNLKDVFFIRIPKSWMSFAKHAVDTWSHLPNSVINVSSLKSIIVTAQ